MTSGGNPAGVSVRQAGTADWPALRQVRLAALADTPWAFGATLAQEQRLGAADWQQRVLSAAWYLAWQDGETVGVAAAFPQPPAGPPRSHQAGPAGPAGPAGATGAAGRAAGELAGPAAEWHLVSMWASPQVRGSGVAGQLVAAVARHASAAGAQRLTLWVAEENGRAYGFYRRAGFVPTGRRQTYRRRDGSGFGEQELALRLPG